MNFRDTACLNNITATGKENTLALAMYYKLGKFDPSDKHVKTYRNKDIINLYKKNHRNEVNNNKHFIENMLIYTPNKQ